MELRSKIRKYLPLTGFIILLGLILTGWILYYPTIPVPKPAQRKAIILCSANDFYRKEGEPGFNNGVEAEFIAEGTNWTWSNQTNGYGGPDRNYHYGHDGQPGALQLICLANGFVHMEFVYNWTDFYPLLKYAAYNLSAWVNISTYSGIPVIINPPGAGVRIGLRWMNSTNGIVRTDWSKGIFNTTGQWNFVNVTGICDDFTGMNEITQLQLVLSVEGVMNAGEQVLFDGINVDYWFPPPIPNPPPNNQDTDGFPAQALQVYWILKDNGYSDDNIFLMLYHTGDDIIDIDAFDGIPNDLNRSGVEAVVDVENNNVNSSRFRSELNVSISGSFASSIRAKDQLIIYMVDHGSNKIESNGNATFHFEADNSYITEIEFFNLISQINCKRMMINLDFCFSGNFLNQNSSIGSSWYNIPNSILITSTTDILSWYWRDNTNADGFAGSIFFHHFWNQLNQNQTIGDAFNYAINVIPSGQIQSINSLQSPLIQDNLGIKDTWSFNNTLQL
jgi:hypothetical protein